MSSIYKANNVISLQDQRNDKSIGLGIGMYKPPVYAGVGSRPGNRGVFNSVLWGLVHTDIVNGQDA